MASPVLTIGIVSCNRLFYLRALVESMRLCLPLDRIECHRRRQRVDRAGAARVRRERRFPGRTGISRRAFARHRSRGEALNTIIERARAPYVLLLTDDVQFIVKGDEWLNGVLELAADHKQLGSIMPIALRRVTIRRYFDSSLRARLFPRTVPARLRTRDGRVTAICFDRKELGVTHSALGITAVDTWRRLGPFKTSGASQSLQDAGAGAEDDVVRRYERAGLRLRKALLEVPAIAEIITDPKGTQARVRGNRRYGRYFAPPQGPFYYRVWSEPEAAVLPHGGSAIAFEDIVQPLGFDLPYDDRGNRLRSSIDSADPFTWIDPQAAGTELR